jgi:dephospho-CoA kinase
MSLGNTAGMSILIGLTGTHGSGKGTVVEYLVSAHQFTHFAVSEFLAAELVRRGRTPDRPARAQLANELRAQGPTGLIEAVYRDADLSGFERIILEPQYTLAEVEFVKEQGGIEIAVDADMRIRYDRIIARGSPKDQVTYETFVAHQLEEMVNVDPHAQNLAATMEAADYLILNNSTLGELHTQIDAIVNVLAS